MSRKSKIRQINLPSESQATMSEELNVTPVVVDQGTVDTAAVGAAEVAEKPAEVVNQPATVVAEPEKVEVLDPVNELADTPEGAVDAASPAAEGVEKEDTPLQAEVTETHNVPAAAEAAPVAAEAVVASGSEEEAYLAKVQLSGTPAQLKMLEALESFSTNTAPGKLIQAREFVGFQSTLLKAFESILDLPYPEFRPAWSVALVYVQNKYLTCGQRSAISESFCNRFPHAWPRQPERLAALNSLLTILRLTREPKTRALKTKTIMFDKAGHGILSTRALENLKMFYNAG